MSWLPLPAPATKSADPIEASPLALQPELLQAFLRLYGTLWSLGELDQASHELAAAVALFMGFSKIAVALGGLPDSIPVVVQPTPICPATS